MKWPRQQTVLVTFLAIVTLIVSVSLPGQLVWTCACAPAVSASDQALPIGTMPCGMTAQEMRSHPMSCCSGAEVSKQISTPHYGQIYCPTCKTDLVVLHANYGTTNRDGRSDRSIAKSLVVADLSSRSVIVSGRLASLRFRYHPPPDNSAQSHILSNHSLRGPPTA